MFGHLTMSGVSTHPSQKQRKKASTSSALSANLVLATSASDARWIMCALAIWFLVLSH